MPTCSLTPDPSSVLIFCRPVQSTPSDCPWPDEEHLRSRSPHSVSPLHPLSSLSNSICKFRRCITPVGLSSLVPPAALPPHAYFPPYLQRVGFSFAFGIATWAFSAGDVRNGAGIATGMSPRSLSLSYCSLDTVYRAIRASNLPRHACTYSMVAHLPHLSRTQVSLCPAPSHSIGIDRRSDGMHCTVWDRVFPIPELSIVIQPARRWLGQSIKLSASLTKSDCTQSRYIQ